MKRWAQIIRDVPAGLEDRFRVGERIASSTAVMFGIPTRTIDLDAPPAVEPELEPDEPAPPAIETETTLATARNGRRTATSTVKGDGYEITVTVSVAAEINGTDRYSYRARREARAALRRAIQTAERGC